MGLSYEDLVMDGSGGIGVEIINSANDATMNQDGHNSEGADGRFGSVWKMESLPPTPEGTCSGPGPVIISPCFSLTCQSHIWPLLLKTMLTM